MTPPASPGRGEAHGQAVPARRGAPAPAGDDAAPRDLGGDGLKRGGSVGAVGAAGLREVRTAAAALAAKGLGTGAGEVDGVVGRGEVVGDADDEPGLAVVDADDGDDA